MAVPEKDDETGSVTPPDSNSPRNHDSHLAPVSDRGLLMFIVALAVALVLGYFFLNKLAAISQQEDCMLAHRRSC